MAAGRGDRVVYGAALEKRSPIDSERGFESHPLRGEVLEWSNRHAWRACVGVSSTVGSNPTLSASLRQGYGWQARFIGYAKATAGKPDLLCGTYTY
jgi:hypothetical protein